MQDIDINELAVVDKKFESKVQKNKIDKASQISLSQYKPNHLTYKTKTNSVQTAVFSEIYYDKGWNAYIDGKPAEHFRANYILRAMNIPQGEHTIEFKFEPKVWAMGNTVSLIGSILMFLFIAYGVFVEYKKQKSAA